MLVGGLALEGRRGGGGGKERGGNGLHLSHVPGLHIFVGLSLWSKYSFSSFS